MREHGWDELVGRFFGPGLWTAHEREEGFVPTLDFRETEESFELTAEVPGLRPEEIEVTLNGDILTLRGEKKEEREETEADYHLVERRFGSFQRSLRLPAEVDKARLTAIHKDGVLKVTLPKAAGPTAVKVEVRPN